MFMASLIFCFEGGGRPEAEGGKRRAGGQEAGGEGGEKILGIQAAFESICVFV